MTIASDEVAEGCSFGADRNKIKYPGTDLKNITEPEQVGWLRSLATGMGSVTSY